MRSGALRSRITANTPRQIVASTAMVSCGNPSTGQRPMSGMAKLSVEQGAVGLDVDGQQDQEGPEHEEVRHAGHRPLQEPALPEHLDELRAEALAQVLAPVVRRLPRSDHPVEPPRSTPCDRQRHRRHRQADDQSPSHCASLIPASSPGLHEATPSYLDVRVARRRPQDDLRFSTLSRPKVRRTGERCLSSHELPHGLRPLLADHREHRRSLADPRPQASGPPYPGEMSDRPTTPSLGSIIRRQRELAALPMRRSPRRWVSPTRTCPRSSVTCARRPTPS